MAEMYPPKVQDKMDQMAKQACESQGGAYREGGGGKSLAEVFDANRGSDTGGSNAPKKTNG